jgi:hypothetical protein
VHIDSCGLSRLARDNLMPLVGELLDGETIDSDANEQMGLTESKHRVK